MKKETIDKLSSPDITKKEYDLIITEIAGIVNDIWNFIIKESGANLDWWAFDNDQQLGGGNGSTGGEFDLIKYKDFIQIIGQNTIWKQYDNPYNQGFPTELLWDNDWRNTIFKKINKSLEIAAAKKKSDKQKREKRNKKRPEIKKIIQSKLTKKELKYIKFK